MYTYVENEASQVWANKENLVHKGIQEDALILCKDTEPGNGERNGQEPEGTAGQMQGICKSLHHEYFCKDGM